MHTETLLDAFSQLEDLRCRPADFGILTLVASHPQRTDHGEDAKITAYAKSDERIDLKAEVLASVLTREHRQRAGRVPIRSFVGTCFPKPIYRQDLMT